MRPRLRLPALLMTALAAGGATLLLSPARADDIAGTSRIEEVTVFPRGAEIARVVRIKVPAGNHTVILRDLQGLSYQEMALRLALPEGTVKSRINRGREELARLLLRAQQPRRRIKASAAARRREVT